LQNYTRLPALPNWTAWCIFLALHFYVILANQTYAGYQFTRAGLLTLMSVSHAEVAANQYTQTAFRSAAIWGGAIYYLMDSGCKKAESV
jgi:hypothetical protein